MKRIAKLSVLATTLLIILIPVFTLLVWFNWNELFGNKRPLEALHSLYELELKGKEISAMKNINNDTEFLVEGDNLTPFFTLLEEHGYSIVTSCSKRKFIILSNNKQVSNRLLGH